VFLASGVLFVMTGPSNNAPPVGRQDARTPDWALPGVQEFVPGRLDPSALVGPILSTDEQSSSGPQQYIYWEQLTHQIIDTGH
jgi:hypothetical protein